MIRIVTIGILALTAVAMADDDAHAKLLGSWQSATADAKEASSFTLKRTDENMHIAGSNGDKTIVEIDCKLSQECAIKDEGHRAKATMYFNGPMLVENETMGSRVFRRRFTVKGDGNTLEVEVIPIDPDGKTKTIVFKRVDSPAAKQ